MKGSLPRRYAKALLDLAKEENQVEAIGRDLSVFEKSLSQNTQVIGVLGNTLFDLNQRLSALTELASRANLPPTLKNFLLLLLKKGRFSLLPAIVIEFGYLQDKVMNIVRATLVTAMKSDHSIGEVLEKHLSQSLKKQVIAEERVDTNLIGGAVLKVDDTIYDGSVKTQLKLMRERMMKG